MMNANMNMYRHNAPKQKLLPEDFLEKTFSEYLACHPTYMIPLIRAHNFIMRDLGPLNLVYRHYIGMLAASRHRCAYLINLSKKEYLFNGGDPEWLKNGDKVPAKLRALQSINKILAHQPWLFTKTHIESLTKGPSPWSLSELTHAIIIMAHFHALCSLAFGCKFGLAEPENFTEEDGLDYEEVEIEELRFDANEGSQKIKKIVRRSPASRLIVERCRQLELENANLAEMLSFNKMTEKKKKGRGAKGAKGGGQAGGGAKGKKGGGPNASGNNKGDGNGSGTNVANAGVPSTSSESLASTLSNESTNSAGGKESPKETTTTTAAAPASQGQSENQDPTPPPPFQPNTWSDDEWTKNHYETLLEDGAFMYTDFASRGRPSEVSTFRIQDYQWDDQGYSLCNLLYPDIGPFLDEKFKVGYNLTYYTLGPKTNIDTSPFRRAIWNYIQCVYGMRHDDYNYREVNILLERHLKCFIKNLACFPERCPKQDFSAVMKGFRASEKIHVIIMVSEARLQTEVLYAMRTLTEFMKLTT